MSATTLYREEFPKVDHGLLYWKTIEFPEAKDTRYTRFKYRIEFLMALCAFVLLAPFLLLVALMIKLDSRGPVLFKQQRYGLAGKKFSIYKFRTMVDKAHEMQKELQSINEMNGGGLFKSNNDPRITRIGRFLRKFSIDELPQLLNILKGEMTVIGPRPLSTPIEYYEESELKRFAVRPGLGCIWQAHFRKETDFRMWMKTDCIYVDAISFQLDMKLLLTIAFNAVIAKGAR